jgi:hypothetical protein
MKKFKSKLFIKIKKKKKFIKNNFKKQIKITFFFSLIIISKKIFYNYILPFDFSELSLDFLNYLYIKLSILLPFDFSDFFNSEKSIKTLNKIIKTSIEEEQSEKIKELKKILEEKEKKNIYLTLICSSLYIFLIYYFS